MSALQKEALDELSELQEFVNGVSEFAPDLWTGAPPRGGKQRRGGAGHAEIGNLSGSAIRGALDRCEDEDVVMAAWARHVRDTHLHPPGEAGASSGLPPGATVPDVIDVKPTLAPFAMPDAADAATGAGGGRGNPSS